MLFKICLCCAIDEIFIELRLKRSAFATPRNQDGRACGVQNPRFHLTKLPPEIMNEILDIAIADDSWIYGIYTISRVCRAFHFYSQSRLFKEISLYSSTAWHSLAPACPRVKSLSGLVHADPGLGQCCKSFKFSLALVSPKSDKDPLSLTVADYDIGRKMLKSLPNIQRLKVQGGFGHQHAWPFLTDAIHFLHSLESVKFNHQQSTFTFGEATFEEPELFLADAWKCVEGSKLMRLGLRGIRAMKDGSTWSISKDQEKTSPIVDISLVDFGETPEALGTLLNLPKALQIFCFHLSSGCCESGLWTPSVLQTLLYDNHASLKSLEIGALSGDTSPVSFGTFRVRDFFRLEKLTLSRWSTDMDITAEAACTVLLAPNLRHFVWDFGHLRHSRRVDWDAFGHQERDWILKFAQLAIERESALRKIEIFFKPYTSVSFGYGRVIWEQTQAKNFWPWDLMDEVRDAISPDIELSYNSHMTREELDDLLKKGQQTY